MKPVLQHDPALLLRAQPVRVVFFDIDGVFTDGGLYFSEHGETLKRFHTLDGQGIKMLQRMGITPAVITGRDLKNARPTQRQLGGNAVSFFLNAAGAEKFAASSRLCVPVSSEDSTPKYRP